ncbi:MAG: PQQ-dependent sugar dehydrogenase [Mobilitalea sp.]
MYQNSDIKVNLKAAELNNTETVRYLNPSDINIAPGYKIEVFAQGLDSPISLLFTEAGDMIIAESGLTSGNPRVMQLFEGQFYVIAENFSVPISGINYLEDTIYVSSRGNVSTVKLDGSRKNIIKGLPCNGDYYNNRVVFGPENKMYFGVGTATNSGVVGLDNEWVELYPSVCDLPGDYIILEGQNFVTPNMLIDDMSSETVGTGAYSPYGVPNLPYEIRKGILKASGSILRSNLDGTDLELYAWGFRNPSYMEFDQSFNLFVGNNGYEVRGSRPIANALDELYLVSAQIWHGWPDFSGGEPVNTPRFKPEGRPQPEFLLKSHPNTPPRPYTTFPVNSNIMGFDFNYNTSFGPYGDVYIAEFGSRGNRRTTENIPYAGTGHRVSKIDINTRTVTTFAINKSGFPASTTQGGGFERPADVVFGPDGAMYVLDLGLNVRYNPNVFVANTGVIWKISRI